MTYTLKMALCNKLCNAGLSGNPYFALSATHHSGGNRISPRPFLSEPQSIKNQCDYL